MSINRYAKRRDIGEAEIVKLLRGVSGVSVLLTDAVDLVVGYKGSNYLVELKAVSALSKKTGEVLESKIKDSQKKLRDEWTGSYLITASLDEILKHIGVIDD